MFRIGQKVICVDASGQDVVPGEFEVSEGEIYTVRGTVDWYGIAGVTLVEILNAHDRAYRATRFRPIVERKTDISIFEEILRRESVPDECAPAAVYGVDWGASA